MSETIKTSLTEILGIKYPIILAGMNKAAGATLAAEVTNSGGLGVIGGVRCTPRILKLMIKDLKSKLKDPNGKFGVDLLIPKIGNGARKTNFDYNQGKLDELIDIIIDNGASVFVCAVGVPPKYIVDKLHKHGILVMNMIGAPKHVTKALAQGVDGVICQGSEGGGHTGIISTTVLLPNIVDMCKDKYSAFTGKKILVIGAGGIFDGRGLAMSLLFGCSGAWIGTRFVASVESGASVKHKKAIINASLNDTKRTLVYTGRPLRVITNKYVNEWETDRKDDMNKLLNDGIIPVYVDMKHKKEHDMYKEYSKYELKPDFERYLCGMVAGNINDILPAKLIIQNIINDAVTCIKSNYKLICKL